MDTVNGTGTPNHLTFSYDADNRITNPGFSYDDSAGVSNGNLTSAVINGESYQFDNKKVMYSMRSLPSLNTWLFLLLYYEKMSHQLEKIKDGPMGQYKYIRVYN